MKRRACSAQIQNASCLSYDTDTGRLDNFVQCARYFPSKRYRGTNENKTANPSRGWWWHKTLSTPPSFVCDPRRHCEGAQDSIAIAAAFIKGDEEEKGKPEERRISIHRSRGTFDWQRHFNRTTENFIAQRFVGAVAFHPPSPLERSEALIVDAHCTILPTGCHRNTSCGA